MTAASPNGVAIDALPLIQTSGLTKRYGKNVLALDTLDLLIGGGVTGLVGANGAGKSTLIKILLGLLAPTSGEASILGFDVRTQGTKLRQFVGYMPEHDCLPPDVTATDFVAHMAQISGIPRAAARERTAEVLRHVGLFEERYRPMGGYSTGMKQRVKLAQALVHDPRLLMLDEPTNGLDPAGRDDMLDLIRRVGADFQIAILMSSHLLGEIERVCDYLVVIDGGRLVRSDTLSSFTGEMQVLTVEVESRQDELVARLQAEGLQVAIEGRLILIHLDGSAPYDLVRDAVVGLDAGLLRLEQRRHRLEDLFRSDEAEEAESG
ncbi:MAG: ATP-binding cassette domain-containing protein [Dehalococcoidia bacterium]|nr:ATP-binding cassette domain-containing protein [Dehalococcoidia bacterium]